MKSILMTTFALGLLLSGTVSARSLYLNGTDISSARNQTLKNVVVRINDHGDVFLEAPQYQVSEEDTFVPLSNKNKPASGAPTALEHKPAGEFPSKAAEALPTNAQTPTLPVNSAAPAAGK